MDGVNIIYYIPIGPDIIVSDITGNVIDSAIDITTEMVCYLVIDDIRIVDRKALLEDERKPIAVAASETINHLLIFTIKGEVIDELNHLF